MNIAMKTKKMHKHIKKPMNITTKMKTNQKTHEHSIDKAQKVKKSMSIAEKTKKENSLPEPPPPPEDILPFWAPALGNIAPSHAHTASPRPLARTHDTNTKRNRNRFPDWGQLRRLFPLNLRYIYIYTDKTTRCVIRSLTGRGLGPEGRRRRWLIG